MNETQNNL